MKALPFYRLQLPPKDGALGFCEDHWALCQHSPAAGKSSFMACVESTRWPGHQGGATPL